ncbi:MAG: hypothetical protein PUI37_06760 [Oscillospiraceae bacterium]|nr:hypothetical protein [Oscillospiraceae bacterium]
MTLEEMKNVDVRSVDRDSLVDIADIKVDPSLSREERIADYLSQIKNPYLFICNGVVVKLSFADTTHTLEDRTEQYIRQRQKQEYT